MATWTSSASCACNVVAYTLAPGEYNLETFEPYGLEFLKLMVLERGVRS